MVLSKSLCSLNLYLQIMSHTCPGKACGGPGPPGLLLAQPAVLTLLRLHITKSVSQAVQVQPLQVPAPRCGCGCYQEDRTRPQPCPPSPCCSSGRCSCSSSQPGCSGDGSCSQVLQVPRLCCPFWSLLSCYTLMIMKLRSLGPLYIACQCFEISSLTSVECFCEFSNPPALFVKSLGDVVNLLRGSG